LIATKRLHRLSYEILSDVYEALGFQFGVLFHAPERYRELLIGLGIDLEERHGNGGWLIAMPATFMIDQSGVIRYAFANVDLRAGRSLWKSSMCCTT
jgi:peroxiredoxin